jgi:hypothetical protein
VLRPRGRAPATPRNRARPREDHTTIALLRQQQEIMAQMVEQQRRRSCKYQMQKPVPLRHLRWRFYRRHQSHQHMRYLSHTYSRTSTGPGSPARSRGLVPNCTCNGHQCRESLQVWTPRTQPNSWRSMSGTPRRLKYLLRRSCRRQSEVSVKQRFDERNSTRVSGKALQNFAPNF